MRRTAILTVATVLLALIATAGSAQQAKRDVYAKTIPIEKIYGHQYGYKIYYFTRDLTLHSFFIPNRWFVRAGGKGQIVWGDAPEYPYFTVFWRDGEFNLIRLYVQKNLGDQTWGMLSGGEEIQEQFNVEEPQLVF